MRRWRAAAVALGLAVVAAAPAAAATPAQVTEALRRSPLFVDPALADAVPGSEGRAALRAIAAAPHPVFVALVPLVPGDRYGGDARRFLAVVHGRLGRDGVYVTVDEGLLSHRAYGVDEERPDLSQASTVANFEAESFEEPQIAKVRRFAEALRAPDLAARFTRVEARLQARREQPAPSPAAPAAGSGPGGRGAQGDGTPWLVAGGLIGGALLVGGGLTLRRRRARLVDGTAPLLPERVFEHARTAAAGDVREEVEQRLLAFAEHVDQAGTPHDPAAQDRQQHALDAYAAARRVLTAEPQLVDLVGALVLVQHGSDALGAAAALEAGLAPPAPAPLCFFDPRHPGGAEPLAWRDGLEVAACPACARAMRAGRAPQALQDAGRPWFETDSLWARTGFGTFEDDLPQRVLRGELRAT